MSLYCVESKWFLQAPGNLVCIFSIIQPRFQLCGQLGAFPFLQHGLDLLQTRLFMSSCTDMSCCVLSFSFSFFFCRYGYYAATDLGLSRRWGLIITPLQLGQFVLCLVYVTLEWFSIIFYGQSRCDNNAYTLAWVYACYLVFLYLFYKMYTEKKQVFAKKKE
jgi:hypothetical protein